MSIIRRGPFQPEKHELMEKNYPQEHGHRFNTNQYYRVLHSGERIKRDWLSFSVSNSRMYCLYCMFFGKNKQRSWTVDGFHAWQRLQDISLHEKTENHINAAIIVKMKLSCIPILPQIYENKKKQILENREIINALIEITLFLSQHSLPFRGHRESWDERNKGNFKDLVILISKFSPELAVYINHLKTKGKSEVNFISWRRQNQLISSVATFIKRNIRDEIKKAKYFSISIDTTFDSSKREQLAFIVRYVSFKETSPVICERLLALKESSLTTGHQLFSIFQDICLENELDWRSLLVGQSYDGASNMRGQYEGLQAFIKEVNPSAVYTWCYAHRLNLVVVQVASSSADAVNMFGNVEELYNFISSSKKRIAFYENTQKENRPAERVRRLKRVNTTRWMSYSKALQTVLNTFDIIIDTLENIKVTELSDYKTCSKANGLIEFLLTEKFIMTAICFSKIFQLLDPVTKILQSPDIDLLGAVNSVQVVLDNIKKMRSDKVFQNICNETTIFMEKSDFEFTSLPVKRCRRKKLMAGEFNPDHVITDPKQEYKVNTYFMIIDAAIVSIETRFHSTGQHLLKDISLFSTDHLKQTKKDPTMLPKDAFKTFCNLYHRFVNYEDLRTEYIQYSRSFFEFEDAIGFQQTYIHGEKYTNNNDSEHESEENSDSDRDEDEGAIYVHKHNNLGTLLHMLQVCHKAGLKNVFPCLYDALHIACTLPVASTTPERTFSKLKIVKNRLRTTISQDRLEQLLLMSCESDIEIDNGQVIDIFANCSSVLKKHLL